MSDSRRQILIKFQHGLGDAVQLTCVLRHLARYRPDHDVDVATTIGKQSAFFGLCRRVYVFDRDPLDESPYDSVHDLGWFENYTITGDAPQTKVTNCLREEFGIEPDPELYKYQIQIGDDARRRAVEYLEMLCRERLEDGRFPAVVIHYEGNTSKHRKDLPAAVVARLCELVIERGYVPIILDWDRRSPLPDQHRIFCPEVDVGDLWGGTGTGDAETMAALIAQSRLMVGIDSGPLHVAGATDTPTLGVWTWHSPMQFFDLCPNVLHLVPQHWARIAPCTDGRAAKYFRDHYRYRVYRELEAGLLEAAAAELPPRDGRPAASHGLRWCSGFWIRPDNAAQDMVIVRDIWQRDGYRLGLQLERIKRARFVVDVGAHIGTFARKVHELNPDARIVCVEACPENLDALTANVGSFASILHAACSYETRPLALLNSVRPNCKSTGGSTVLAAEDLDDQAAHAAGYEYWHDRRELPRVTLEDLLQGFGAESIDLLKLDCEGSEFSILGNTPSLERIGFIVGEYHGVERWQQLLAERFAGWDYGHMSQSACGQLGNFHLGNPASPPA